VKKVSRHICSFMGLAMILSWAVLSTGCCRNNSQATKVALNTPCPKTIDGEVSLIYDTQVLQYNIIDHVGQN